jgi:hypothetical protein
MFVNPTGMSPQFISSPEEKGAKQLTNHQSATLASVVLSTPQNSRGPAAPSKSITNESLPKTEFQNSLASYVIKYHENTGITLRFTPEQIGYLEEMNSLFRLFDNFPLVTLLNVQLLSDAKKMVEIAEQSTIAQIDKVKIKTAFLTVEKALSLDHLNQFEFITNNLDKFPFFSKNGEMTEPLRLLKEAEKNCKIIDLFSVQFKLKLNGSHILTKSFDLKLSIIKSLVRANKEQVFLPKDGPIRFQAYRCNMYDDQRAPLTRDDPKLVINKAGIEGIEEARPNLPNTSQIFQVLNENLLATPKQEVIDLLINLIASYRSFYPTNLADPVQTHLQNLEKKVITLRDSLEDPNPRKILEQTESILAYLKLISKEYKIKFKNALNEQNKAQEVCQKEPSDSYFRELTKKTGLTHFYFCASNLFQSFLHVIKIRFVDLHLLSRSFQFNCSLYKIFQIEGNIKQSDELPEAINGLHKDFEILFKTTFTNGNENFMNAALEFHNNSANFDEFQEFCKKTPICFAKNHFILEFTRIHKKYSIAVSKLREQDPETAEKLQGRYQILSLLFSHIPVIIRAKDLEKDNKTQSSVFDNFLEVFPPNLVKCFALEYIDKLDSNEEETQTTEASNPLEEKKLQTTEPGIEPRKGKKIKTRGAARDQQEPLPALSPAPTSPLPEPLKRPYEGHLRSMSYDEIMEILCRHYNIKKNQVVHGGQHDMPGGFPGLALSRGSKSIPAGTVHSILTNAEKRFGKPRI